MRFDKRARTMRYEVWPRFADATVAGATPYAGWPVTKTQLDQYGRAPRAFFPELVIRGVQDPVVQVVDEQRNEVVYTLRIRGTRFQPHVFLPGSYTIRIGGQPGPEKVLTGVVAAAQRAAAGEVAVDLK